MNIPRSSSLRATWALIALLLASLFAVPAAAQPANALVILPVGQKLPADLGTTLSSWRQSGQVSDVLWLDSTQAENAGFQTFVALEFPSENAYRIWLQEGAPKLPAPLVVKRVDVLVHGEQTPRDSNRSVFKVNRYQPTAPASQIKEFATGYIKPLMEGQKATKVLMRYTMFAERDPAGAGQTWLLMEYRDQIAFDRSEAVKGVLRPKLLAENATYAKFDATKDKLRTTGPETLARYSELPPPQLPNIPSYKPETKIVGGLRIVGSELKNAVDQLAEGFTRFHPDAKISTSHIPSSEGGIAALYLGVSDVAPMGDDAKITDMMPFWNTFGYMPTEISVATGGYEKRGSLWSFAIVVNKDNPLNEISVDELTRVFGAERSGGWEFVDNDWRFTSKYARGKETNLRTWGQLGLKGEYANKEIDTFGYSAPGFAIYFERNWFHWSQKWNPNFREYVEYKQTAPDKAGAAVSSTVALDDLQTNKYAMGIAGLMHVKSYPNIKVLRISEKKGGKAIALTPDNVANRTYPLRRDAFFYLNKAPGAKLDPKVREFMRFVLSREGQEIIARVGYYYPLDADYLQEQLKKLD
jgi:phosphate transport system substrate-binding protein